MTDSTNPFKMVSDEEVEKAFSGTNFGSCDPREVIADTVLKIAGGYSTGYTAICCCQELGLLGKARRDMSVSLTKKGQRYLYWSYEQKTARGKL